MTDASFLNGRVRLWSGDSRERVREIAPGTLDAVVCDPPYGLSFMGRAWDNATDQPAFDPTFWADVRRAMKPGAHLVAFAATRQYHRLACAIEDAGFEIRDQLAWVYGSGFPKSHSMARAIGPEWDGWGTALKPAWEPIVLARNPLIGTVAANVLAHGTGAINVDGCRVEGEPWIAHTATGLASQKFFSNGDAKQVFKQPHNAGRWPANIVHDGSDEVVALFPETGPGGVYPAQGARFGYSGGERKQRGERLQIDETGGSAARFFYSAKADADDRIGSKHPTVKPVDLMQWLVRLVTPPGGLILDPFAGSGTTGEAAWREGFDAILIEREDEFRADIARRMDLAAAGPATRRTAIIKARGQAQPVEAIGGLFGDVA